MPAIDVILLVAKVTLAASLGLSAARLARTARASVRHAVLAAAFGVMLLLPLASVVAPMVPIAVPAATPAWTGLPSLERSHDATPAEPLDGPAIAPAPPAPGFVFSFT